MMGCWVRRVGWMRWVMLKGWLVVGGDGSSGSSCSVVMVVVLRGEGVLVIGLDWMGWVG